MCENKKIRGSLKSWAAQKTCTSDLNSRSPDAATNGSEEVNLANLKG